jgi:hypothetical protein
MSDFKAWIAGEKTNISLDENGNLLTSAVFGDVIIEAPGVNSKSDKFEGNLNPATTTTFPFSNVTTGYAYQVANDGLVNMTYAVSNGAANTIKAGEIHVESEYKFTSLTLINALTTSCDFRIKVSGV